MEIVHIEAHAKAQVTLTEEVFCGLDGRVGLVTTIQYLNQLETIAQQLKGHVVKVILGGQLLGCDTEAARAIADSIDSFLYIGTGLFHPVAVAYQTGKPVHTFDPHTGSFSHIDTETITRLEKRKRGAFIRYLNANTIGILVSTKNGQQHLSKARAFRDSLVDKKGYIILSDFITPAIAEDFSFIDCFVNTACPRIVEDDFYKPIINLDDLKAHIGKE